ncbi:MAG: hypothetical protein NTY38_21150 [Acidobacteria bacterium]|nr:hypothetical protein [Acidobacteriota bacterium]
MACPFFYPTERMTWPAAPRTPWGAPYEGLCQAGEAGFRPDEETERELCNFGYARGRCRHYPGGPGGAEADAVRFDGGRYILEKDYGPLCAGGIEALEDPRLRRQAAVFLENLNHRVP